MATPLQVEVTSSPADVALGAGTETVVVTSDPILILGEPVVVAIRGWAQVNNPGIAGTITPRIRRGTAITDPLVGEANATQEGAGVSFNANILVSETVSGGPTYVRYSFTLQATVAATSMQASIQVTTTRLRKDSGGG